MKKYYLALVGAHVGELLAAPKPRGSQEIVCNGSVAASTSN